MQISAVIITKNEERNIERCLASLQGVMDEIVVVDSFSTDETENICKKYNVRFFQQEWLGYAEQKNYANSLATYDMLFSIDADEALSDELRESILFLKKSENLNIVGFVNRLNNYCGKWIHHSGWYPDKKIRFFNRNDAKWTGEIHEILTFSQQIHPVRLKGNLLHYSYSSIDEHIKQMDKFATLSALDNFQKKRTVSFVSLYLKPGWKFVRDFVFNAGFLDGYYGYVICKISAFSVFLKFAKLKQLYKNDKE
jgi:glycosyltransferase involved in cell wall biosynthesis